MKYILDYLFFKISTQRKLQMVSVISAFYGPFKREIFVLKLLFSFFLFVSLFCFVFWRGVFVCLFVCFLVSLFFLTNIFGATLKKFLPFASIRIFYLFS